MKTNRNLILLLAGQFVSQVGDKFHMIALSLLVLKTTGSAGKMGAVLAASLIPSLILGFVSGAFVDRYNRKIIIVVTDLLRGVIIALFAVLFHMGIMNFYIILILQVLLSVNAAFFDPAIPSVIPQIVEGKDLVTANSRHQFVNGFATIIGSFLGGIFVSIFGFFWIFVVNSVSFIVSACFECFIDIPDISSVAAKKMRSGIYSDIKEGYRYIFARQSLLVLVLMVMVIHFFVGAMEVFMPVIANTISSSNGARILGFFQTAFGLGTILTASVLSIRLPKGNEKFSLFGSVFLGGFVYAAASLIAWNRQGMFPVYLMMIFIFGGCIICAGISFKTLLQKKVDNNYAGRVFALAGSVGNASVPGAMIIYGFMLEKFDFQGLLMGSGLILMPLSIISMMLYKEKIYDRSSAGFSKPVTKN